VSETAICTDSSALLPTDRAERLGIRIVPLSVLLDGEAFDERSGDVDGFYARLEQGGEAKTSQPSPGDFADAYADAARRGSKRVLSIHLDARVSGTSRSAELAAREAEIPVSVVDTTTVSYGVGVCVRAAARALEAGASAEEAAHDAANLGTRMQNAFVARTGADGRVPGRADWAVLTFENGAAIPLAVCDSAEAAIEAMTARVQHEDQAVEAAVGHAGAVVATSADSLANALARSTHVVGVERYRVGASVGAHTGPVSFGTFWWPTAHRVVDG